MGKDHRSSQAAHSYEDLPAPVSHEKYETLEHDFQEFAYIVSHDLQAPMRHIREFTRLLLAKIADKVGTKETDYVRIINQSVDRCDQMMVGLLEYSRLNTRGNPFTEVDCNTAVEQAVSGLRRHIELEDVHIKVDALPTLRGDSGQLQQMFSHLIDNAIKFRSADAPLEVRIFSEPEKEGWNIHVEDNGIGIAPEYESQIYTLFRKLNPETPGVGIGLTICRKIADRHGGKLSYRKNSKNGTTFTVFLPKTSY